MLVFAIQMLYIHVSYLINGTYEALIRVNIIKICYNLAWVYNRLRYFCVLNFVKNQSYIFVAAF